MAHIKDLSTALYSYVNGDWPLQGVSASLSGYLHWGEKSRLEAFSQLLLKDWAGNTIDTRISKLAEVDQCFRSLKRQADAKQWARVKALKAHLAGTHGHWQHTLLAVTLEKAQALSLIPLVVDRDAQYPLTHPQRFIQQESLSHVKTHSYAWMGSTFATNQLRLLLQDRTAQGQLVAHPVLDAIYAAYTYDSHQQLTGAVIALGDGCGGHMGMEDQDRVIGKTASMAAKALARYMALYPDPDTLKQAKVELLTAVAKAVNRSYPCNSEGIPIYQEGTTLVGGRIFLSNHQYRFIGFGLGDSLLLAWHPATHTAQTLIPARAKQWAPQQFEPAIMPIAYSADEINTVDITLPSGTVFIPMSDGVYEGLPHESRIETDSQGNRFQTTYLIPEAISALLSPLKPTASIEQIVNTLAQAAIEQTETHRQQRYEQAQQAQARLSQLNALSEQSSQLLPQITQNNNSVIANENDVPDSDALKAASEFKLGDDFTLCGLRLGS